MIAKEAPCRTWVKRIACCVVTASRSPASRGAQLVHNWCTRKLETAQGALRGKLTADLGKWFRFKGLDIRLRMPAGASAEKKSPFRRVLSSPRTLTTAAQAKTLRR